MYCCYCTLQVLLKHHHNTDIVEMLTKCSAPEKDGNTLVHVAALMGNSRLFKVFWHFQAHNWSKSATNSYIMYFTYINFGCHNSRQHIRPGGADIL